jgi:hypothetical protein
LSLWAGRTPGLTHPAVVAVAAFVVAAFPGVGAVVTSNRGFARRPPAPRSVSQAGVYVQLAGVASGVGALAEWLQDGGQEARQSRAQHPPDAGLLARCSRRFVKAVPSPGRRSRGVKPTVPSGW